MYTLQARAKIFTTNYDKCFETAASKAGFVVIDGFSFTQPAFFDASYYFYDLVRNTGHGNTTDYLQNVLHLYKVHGSVDWNQETDGSITKTEKPDLPLLIYPRDNKYQASYDPPFIDMISAFQMAVKQPNTALICVGFGFNDHHLTQPILAALRTNPELKLLVVSPGLKSGKTRANQKVISALWNLMADYSDSRLGFLSANFEQLTQMLPEIRQQTPEEKLAMALRQIGNAK